MSRAVLTILSDADRVRAVDWVGKAPIGTRVEFKAPKRSLPQNARMWSMLTDIATQLTWHGRKLRTEDWKIVFLDGLKRNMDLVPNIDGTGFVQLGRSSSDLSKAEMTEMMELMSCFGAQHGVVFHDPREEQAA